MIKDYCDKNHFPEKIQALLCYFGASDKDLREWKVEYDEKNSPYVCFINGSEYEIYTAKEADDFICFEVNTLLDEAKDRIPEDLQKYFNCMDFYIDAYNKIDVEDVIKDAQEIRLDFGKFYYVEVC